MLPRVSAPRRCKLRSPGFCSAPNILLIPGPSSVGHPRENLAADHIALPESLVAELDAIGQNVPSDTE